MTSKLVKGTLVNLVFTKHFIFLRVLKTFYGRSILYRSLHFLREIKLKNRVLAYIRKPFCSSQSNIFHNNKIGKSIFFKLKKQVNTYIQTVIVNMNTKYFK